MKAEETVFDLSFENGGNFELAAFRLWLPPSLDEEGAKAVVMLTPGSNSDGRGDVLDPLWRGLAERHSLALMGCFFKDKPGEDESESFIERYADASKGSGQAVLDALRLFSEQCKRRELEKAGLLLFGHSAGGQFNYEFTCWAPERVVAFVANKGGVYYTHLASKETRETPGLLIAGEEDQEFRIASLKGIFALNRRAGAKWAFASEPEAGHEIGGTPALAASFFESALKVRRKAVKGWKESSGAKLACRYGDLKSLRIRKGGPASDESLAWLPDSDFALRWKAFSGGAS